MSDLDYENWGVSRTSKKTLDDYWSALEQKADHNEETEVKFFLHCTTHTGKKRIEKSGALIGGGSNLPANAPLASSEGLRGIWLAPSPKELPRRSPYGTKRLVFPVKNIVNFLRTLTDPVTELDEDDRWDAPDVPESNDGRQRDKSSKVKAKDKKKKKQQEKSKPKPKSRDEGPRPRTELPLLFFECAHYYGSNQYVRLLLVRSSDPQVEWCREFCKELDFRNNPFLLYRWGRLFTYSSSQSSSRSTDVMVEVLVVGDIVFEKLEEAPGWDEVGTVSRAGFDPRLGVC